MKMCYHPWVGLDISPQGEFKPCCKYSTSLANNVNDYAASGQLAELRNDFLSGNQPAGCVRCWRDEDAGLPSKRLLDNEYIFKNQEPELTSIKVLSIPFGNTCNLACRICNSYSSSRWGAEEKKLKPYFPNIVINDHSKFYKDPKFIKSIIDKTKDVIHVEFPGGEPFYADQEAHHNLIIHLENQGAENISLHYITNGTKFPDRAMLDAWRRFKNVDIQISIDGIQDKFEYNRWPATWGNVLNNIYQYGNLQDTNPNIQISISHSVSIFTVYYLPEFLAWCTKYNLPTPYLGLVSRPDYFNITVLPISAKQIIEQRLQGNPLLEPVIAAMYARDDSSLLDITIKYVKIIDTQRKQDFSVVFPELYQLLGEKCQTLYQLY
jgi:organic radical activating enzyme